MVSEKTKETFVENSEIKIDRPTGLAISFIVLVPSVAILFGVLFLLMLSRITGGLFVIWTPYVVYALLLTVSASCIGGGVLGAVWWKWPVYLPQGIMAAMGLRMFITLGGIVFFVLILTEVRLQFLFYTAVFYGIGLISETVTAIKIIRKYSMISGQPEDFIKSRLEN